MILSFWLDELKKENLIEDNNSYVSPFSGMNRREVIRRIGFASVVALPVISSLIAPTAAMAQSVCTPLLTPEQFCAVRGAECGVLLVTDECGNTVDCGNCPPDSFCDNNMCQAIIP
jgi:hypothetical protein